MSFSLTKGTPIAYIDGGKFSNKVVRVTQDKNGSKSFQLPSGKFEPLLDPQSREVIYIAGPSGAGKSTLTKLLSEVYNELFPNSPIFLFSKLKNDKAYDDLEKNGIITRVVIDERLIENPIEILDDISPTEGALFIFDDTDTINDKKILDQITKLKRDIMEVGRHNNIYSIQTSHLINGINKNECRNIMNELHKLIIFPGSGGYKQQKYVLENYWGLDKKQIKKILKTDSRWLCISKNYPQYVLTDDECYILK